MKRVLFCLLLLSFNVSADVQHHGGNWVAPLIGGIVVGTIVGNTYSRPTPPSVYYPPNYGGSPYGYHYESIYDAYCGCYKTVLAPNY